MSRLYRRQADASVAISNRRQLGDADRRPRCDPTPERRRALADIAAGIKPSAAMRWALIRDGFLKPGAM